jgi:hypothetical protein
MHSEAILPSWNWTAVTVAISTGLFVGELRAATNPFAEYG